MLYWYVALAGGLGALGRFSLSRFFIANGWQALPYATFAVNIIGSFLIGYFAYALQQRWGLSDDVKAIVMSGFLGGFTTFSAFSLEVIMLFEQGFVVKAALYVVMTVLSCLLLCALGVFIAKHALH